MWNPLETDETKQKRILPQKHSVWVRSLSFSSDRRFLASADYNGEIKIWSTEVRNLVKRCRRVCDVLLSMYFYFVSLHFFPFLELDAPFLYFNIQALLLVPESLVDATRLVE